MRKQILVLLIFLALGTAVQCQSAPHPSVTLTWVLSVDDTATICAAPNVCIQNIYRIAGTCSGTFALPTGATPIASGLGSAITTFTDTSVSIGQKFCYATTLSVNGIESSFSTSVSAVILPSPQTNLKSVTQ